MGVNKVVFNEHTLIDISDSTVTAATLAKGQTAYGADGEKITGTMTSSASPKLQKKTVTPDRNPQIVQPDSGYDGLSDVLVNSIPSNYVVPVGNITITRNGTYSVVSYRNAEVAIAQSPITVTPERNERTYTPWSNYEGFSSVTVEGDENLVPENIVSGISIFGVKGIAEVGGGGDPGGGNPYVMWAQVQHSFYDGSVIVNGVEVYPDEVTYVPFSFMFNSVMVFSFAGRVAEIIARYDEEGDDGPFTEEWPCTMWTNENDESSWALGTTEGFVDYSLVTLDIIVEE